MALGDPYVTSTELAAYLRMDITAGNEAATELSRVVNAASRWVNEWTGREFNLATAATARYFDVYRSGTVLVDDIGHATISVATDTSQDGTYATSWATTDFQVNPLGALDASEPVTSLLAVGSYTFPFVSRRHGLVRVTARWGWPAVPADVKEAAMLQAARLFKRRDSTEGVLGGNDFGVVRVGGSPDPDAVALLQPYRLMHIAAG